MNKLAGKEYTLVGQQMICPICEKTYFTATSTLLDSKGASVLSLDWSNPNADTFICTSCNHILWFLGSEIGKNGKMYTIEAQKMRCPLCPGEHFVTRHSLMSSQRATLLSMNWASPRADNFICTRCGFIQWFFTETTTKLKQGKTYHIDERSLICIRCMHRHFTLRNTLLSSRGAVFMNMDWAHPTASNYICASCHFVHWFA